MAHDLAALLGPDGVCSSAVLTRSVDRHTVARWVADRRLLRPFPGVLLLPSHADRWRTRALAAVIATDGVLSHTSALTVWRLAPGAGAIHVSVPAARRAARGRGLVVHRVQRLDPDRLGGLPVTRLPRTLVDSWGSAHAASGSTAGVELVRGAVIGAVRDRQVRTTDLRAEVDRRVTLPGRAALLRLLGLVEQGCQSELEIWGVREVLDGRGMAAFVQQHRVALPHGVAHLDAAIPELKIAVEMDGAAFHGSAADRERDTRRDVALAAEGWVVLRFSYRRLTREPEACRREILAVVRARAAQIR